MKTVVSIVLIGFLFGGCGSNSSTNNTNNTGIGYYIDSAVSGVSYVCGNESGITGEDGSFVFEKGKGCTFKLGDITLRSVNADNLIDKVKIVEDRVEVAQMLQSLDTDGNPDNGITISAKVIEKLKEQQIAKLPETTQELQAILDAAKEVEGFKGEMVSVEDAKAHLEKSQTQVTKELFAGKTLYMVDGSRITSVEFNQDATKLTFIDTDGTKKVYNSEIKGNTIVDESGIHYIDSVTEKYISGHDKRGTWKFYFNKSDAQKALESTTGGSDNSQNEIFVENVLTGKTVVTYKKEDNGKPSMCLTLNGNKTLTFVFKKEDELKAVEITDANWHIEVGKLIFYTEKPKYQIWTPISENNEIITYKNEWYNGDGTLDESDTRELKVLSSCPTSELVND